MRYHICPICKGLMQPSVWGRRYMWCGYCAKTHDVDDTIIRDDDETEQEEE